MVSRSVACTGAPRARFSSVDVGVVWAAVGAVGSVAAAGIAAWAAHQSRASAEKANEAAGALAAIERDRRYEELTPEFRITCTVKGGTGLAYLRIILTGGRLEALDAVTVTILDEAGQDHWGRGLPDGVTQEEAQAFVWGPWEFSKGMSEQVVSNRESRPQPYSRVSGKNWDVLPMAPTGPGRWVNQAGRDEWRKWRKDQPVRLLLTCRRNGYEPWFIQRDVKVEQEEGSPQIRVVG